MPKIRYFNTSFWVDNYVETLNKNEKYLFLYYVTSPYTNLCGAYEVSIKRIAFETELQEKEIKRILDKFEQDCKMMYKGGWLFIKNYQKNQSTNPNILKGIEREMGELPEDIRKSFEDFTKSCSTLRKQGQPNLTKPNLTKPNSNRELPAKPVTPLYEEVDLRLAEYLLNLIRKNNSNFKKPNLYKWSEDIRKMRTIDKRGVKQIEAIIQFAQSDEFWKTNILSAGKLRKQFDQLYAKAKQTIKSNVIPKV